MAILSKAARTSLLLATLCLHSSLVNSIGFIPEGGQGIVKPFMELKVGDTLGQPNFKVTRFIDASNGPVYGEAVYEERPVILKCLNNIIHVKREQAVFEALDKAMGAAGRNPDGQDYIAKLEKGFKVDGGYCFATANAGSKNILDYSTQLTAEEKSKILPALFDQVARGLAYLHRSHIAHSDITPRNIIIGQDKAGKPKATIIDFDASRLLTVKDGKVEKLTMEDGAMNYMPPEAFQIKTPIDIRKVDTWGLGATLYHVAMSKIPFDYRNPKIPSKLEQASRAEKELQQQMQRMLNTNILALTFYNTGLNAVAMSNPLVKHIRLLMLIDREKRLIPEDYLRLYPFVSTAH
ncbi:kinase-like domain-containing protein [Syncephalis fuscata]|nr:kinase-like domain-containing protein [Syncephalis fuscata]